MEEWRARKSGTKTLVADGPQRWKRQRDNATLRTGPMVSLPRLPLQHKQLFLQNACCAKLLGEIPRQKRKCGLRPEDIKFSSLHVLVFFKREQDMRYLSTWLGDSRLRIGWRTHDHMQSPCHLSRSLRANALLRSPVQRFTRTANMAPKSGIK